MATEYLSAGHEALAQGAWAEALLRQLARQRAVDNDEPNDSVPLTRREQQVLRLVAQGLTDKEIAVKLTISEHTVHRHIANIRTKLNCPSRTAAVAYASQHGLL